MFGHGVGGANTMALAAMPLQTYLFCLLLSNILSPPLLALADCCVLVGGGCVLLLQLCFGWASWWCCGDGNSSGGLGCCWFLGNILSHSFSVYSWLIVVVLVLWWSWCGGGCCAVVVFGAGFVVGLGLALWRVLCFLGYVVGAELFVVGLVGG